MVICRALKNCISCLSQMSFQCIWQADEDPTNRYPCRNGYSDVEITSPVEFFKNITQCTRILNASIADDGFIRVPAMQYEKDHHGQSHWIYEFIGIFSGVVFSVSLMGSVLCILNRRFRSIRRSARSSRQTEGIELLPREAQNQNSDTESEYGHNETMRDLESVLRASSAGIGGKSSHV